jgi:CheY-like chemotaxis protein
MRDTGPGIPDEVRAHVFEPFFTTKEAGRGTGLGLSTVYGFVSQSRGAMALDSTVGVGTTVTLYIPATQQAAAAPAAEHGDALVPPGLQVLLVEDDAEVRNVVQAFLDALGCRTTACASGEQALLALDSGASFDLLLSDIALGSGMRGTRLATQAQQRMPKLGVLLMSGYSAELLEADRDAPPSWELLRKPYDRAQLARAIVKVLQQG